MLTSTVFWNASGSVSAIGPKYGFAAALLTSISRQPCFAASMSNTSGAMNERPMISASVAYSSVVNP